MDLQDRSLPAKRCTLYPCVLAHCDVSMHPACWCLFKPAAATPTVAAALVSGAALVHGAELGLVDAVGPGERSICTGVVDVDLDLEDTIATLDGRLVASGHVEDVAAEPGRENHVFSFVHQVSHG